MKPLEKLVMSVLDLHCRELVPARRECVVPRQLLLFPEMKTFHHVSLGNYYESMTAGLWGGKLTNRVMVARNGNGSSEEFNVDEFDKGDSCNDSGLFQDDELVLASWDMGEEGLIKPDLIDKEGRAIGESKACVSGHSCNLFDAQLHRYKEIQVKETDSEIYFVFYRHNLKKIKSYEGSEEDLFKEMADRTFFAVRLPFSAVLAMHKSGEEGLNCSLFRRYDGMRFDWCTIIRSPTLNRLFSDTENTLEEIGLNIENYSVERYLSPSNFEVERQKVRQFPILWVSDRHHESWVREFVSENEDLVKKLEYDPRWDGCSDC